MLLIINIFIYFQFLLLLPLTTYHPGLLSTSQVPSATHASLVSGDFLDKILWAAKRVTAIHLGQQWEVYLPAIQSQGSALANQVWLEGSATNAQRVTIVSPQMVAPRVTAQLRGHLHRSWTSATKRLVSAPANFMWKGITVIGANPGFTICRRVTLRAVRNVHVTLKELSEGQDNVNSSQGTVLVSRWWLANSVTSAS